MTPVKSKHKKTKHVKVKHVHHKSYRKRHYLTLFTLILLGVVVLASTAAYLNESYVAQRIASQTISDIFSEADSTKRDRTVSSTYGFSLKYNTKQYHPSAVDESTGELYVGSELDTPRAYDTVRLSKQNIDSSENSSVKLNYYSSEKVSEENLIDIEQKYIIQKQSNQDQLKKASSQQKVYDGVTFQRTVWTRDITAKSVNLKTSFVTYTGVVHGSPLTLIVYQGISSDSADDVIGGLSFTERKQVFHTPSEGALARKNISLGLMDSVLGMDQASAAVPSFTASERISAAYGAAVVKIYNIEVGDLAIDGKTVVSGHLAGGTGSGFIVSSDGYVATNGHVAVIDPRDEIVIVALEELQDGNTAPFYSLVDMSTATQQEMDRLATDDEKGNYLIKKIYDIPSSRFSFVNSKQNLLVGLNENQVDIKELVRKTQTKRNFNGGSSVRQAKLIESDYDGIILPSVTGQFTKSDVALIKMEGSHYPMVTIGDIDDLAQGSNLNIMGFPGIGSDNGIVSETKTSSTLTTGKVSSLKTDTGGHKLIETDTEIGHGNSGGPAFSDEGKVIGIATYAIDPGGQGDGTLNYVRDVKDFQSIAEKASIDYKISQTQDEWDKGIDFFYQARYKKAVANFEQAKTLYPDHPVAEKMIATAQKRIANGENIDDFPVVETVSALVVILFGITVTTIFIVRHKKKHNVLAQAVANGVVQPIAPGAPAQYVPILPSAQTQVWPQPAVQPALGQYPSAPVNQPQTTSAPQSIQNTPQPVAQNPYDSTNGGPTRPLIQ